jgi:hypothetical protein
LIRLRVGQFELRASVRDAGAGEASIRLVIQQTNARPLPQRAVASICAAKSGEAQGEAARQMDEGKRVFRVPCVPLTGDTNGHWVNAVAARSRA